MAFPADIGEDVFAFHFKEKYAENGWKVYNAEVEYARMVNCNEMWNHYLCCHTCSGCWLRKWMLETVTHQ